MHSIRINEHTSNLIRDPVRHAPELALELKRDAREMRLKYWLDAAPIDPNSSKAAFSYMAHKLKYPEKSALENGEYQKIVDALEANGHCDALVVLEIAKGIPSPKQYEKMISTPFGHELGLQMLDLLSSIYESKIGNSISKTDTIKILDAFSNAIEEGVDFALTPMPKKSDREDGRERKSVLQSVARSAMELVRYAHDEDNLRKGAMRTMKDCAKSAYLGSEHAWEFAKTVAFHHLVEGKMELGAEWLEPLRKQTMVASARIYSGNGNGAARHTWQSAVEAAQKKLAVYLRLPQERNRAGDSYDLNRSAMEIICKKRLFDSLAMFRSRAERKTAFAKTT